MNNMPARLTELCTRAAPHAPQAMTLVSAGYFLHDLIICIARFDLEGPAYTAHALCCHLVSWVHPRTRAASHASIQ